MVVNRSFVRKYFDDVPIEQAIGLSLGTAVFRNFGEKERRETTMVGVVDDVKQDAPDGAPQPELFIAYAQVLNTYNSQAFVVLRTADDPAAHIDALRTALREEDPTLALDAVMTMDQRVGAALSRPRTYAVLLRRLRDVRARSSPVRAVRRVVAAVSQRSRELAVRSAFGASRAAVIGVALKQIERGADRRPDDGHRARGGVREQAVAVSLWGVANRLAEFRRCTARVDRGRHRSRASCPRAGWRGPIRCRCYDRLAN